MRLLAGVSHESVTNKGILDLKKGLLTVRRHLFSFLLQDKNAFGLRTERSDDTPEGQKEYIFKAHVGLGQSGGKDDGITSFKSLRK